MQNYNYYVHTDACSFHDTHDKARRVLSTEVIVVSNTVTILVTMSDEVKINLWFKACRDILNKGN